MPTESTQWRKFLQPVVTGLVALMAAMVRASAVASIVAATFLVS